MTTPPLSLREWEKANVKGAVLTSEDRLLVDHLNEGGDPRFVVEEWRDAIRLEARSWVGLLHFSSFDVQIVPKLAGANLELVELIDYATGLDALERYPEVRTLDAKGTSLLDLIACLLVEACERVLRAGVLSEYVEVEEDLPVIRGRMQVRKQVLDRFGRIDRLVCRYDEYLTDTVENQILLAALGACAGRVQDASVAMRVHRLLTIFSEVCEVDEVAVRQARTNLIYNRLNDHYRESHALAWVVLRGFGVSDVLKPGAHGCFAFLLDMNKLFEDFVTRWLSQILSVSEFRVSAQRRDRSVLWNAETNRSHGSVIPDLLIERTGQPGRVLPVDAKYKLYDERRLDSGDIYQTFLYAYAYGKHHPVRPTAILIYPASLPTAKQVCLHVRRTMEATSVAELRAVRVGVSAALAEARSHRIGPVSTEMARLVGTAF